VSDSTALGSSDLRVSVVPARRPVFDPTHPIRLAHLAGVPSPYFTPLFRRLASEPQIDFTVLYASSEGLRPVDSRWYGQRFAWDADLLSGYRSRFLRAADRMPGLGEHFWSVRNWDIVSVLARERYDVLSMAGYNSLTYVLAAVAQRAFGGQLLFREEQTLLDPRSLANMVAKQFALRMLFRQGRALYISTENRRWFQHFGVPDERLFFTPYTVDNDELKAAAAHLNASQSQLRCQLGIAAESGPVILAVSRLIPKKQPLFLLEAFRRARERERCVLLIVGSGSLERAMRDQVKRDRIPDVVFAGFLNRSEIARAYAAADVFALLSGERETFGLVVGEAMNFGLPVVVSDRVGCSADLVSSDYNGFVVSSRDPREAAAVFQRLIGDDELRERMGAASSRRIANWDVERTAAGFVAAATDAVADRAHRPVKTS
jgi:glycosyltransferase involved in cell wall biosynthesis